MEGRLKAMIIILLLVMIFACLLFLLQIRRYHPHPLKFHNVLVNGSLGTSKYQTTLFEISDSSKYVIPTPAFSLVGDGDIPIGITADTTRGVVYSNYYGERKACFKTLTGNKCISDFSVVALEFNDDLLLENVTDMTPYLKDTTTMAYDNSRGLLFCTSFTRSGLDVIGNVLIFNPATTEVETYAVFPYYTTTTMCSSNYISFTVLLRGTLYVSTFDIDKRSVSSNSFSLPDDTVIKTLSYGKDDNLYIILSNASRDLFLFSPNTPDASPIPIEIPDTLYDQMKEYQGTDVFMLSTTDKNNNIMYLGEKYNLASLDLNADNLVLVPVLTTAGNNDVILDVKYIEDKLYVCSFYHIRVMYGTTWETKNLPGNGGQLNYYFYTIADQLDYGWTLWTY